MSRTTHAGLVHIQAECTAPDCKFSQGAKNAKGLAAQHADRTGHEVIIEEGFVTVYNKKPSKRTQPQL